MLCFVKQVSATEIALVDFSITPIACIVKQAGNACTMTVKVRWQAQQPISPCLYQATQQSICWQDKSEAITSVAINFKENMIFTLRDGNNHIFASQEIVINTSSSKKYRRRLRANWSLF